MIRKIDNLGRIVIPKELRSVLNLNNNDDVEILLNNKEIVLKKYSYASNYIEYINKLLEIMPSNDTILITDREKIINDCIYKDYKIPKNISFYIENNNIYKSLSLENFVLNDTCINCYYYLKPINLDFNTIGLIILISKKSITKEDEMLINCINAIIENQINIC